MSAEWHKSSYSNTGAQCVEVRETPATVELRDAQNREQGHISFPAHEWKAFLAELESV